MMGVNSLSIKKTKKCMTRGRSWSRTGPERLSWSMVVVQLGPVVGALMPLSMNGAGCLTYSTASGPTEDGIMSLPHLVGNNLQV